MVIDEDKLKDEWQRGKTVGQLVELRLVVSLLEREHDKNKALETLELRLCNMEKGY